jgi:hypothetical protein
MGAGSRINRRFKRCSSRSPTSLFSNSIFHQASYCLSAIAYVKKILANSELSTREDCRAGSLVGEAVHDPKPVVRDRRPGRAQWRIGHSPVLKLVNFEQTSP